VVERDRSQLAQLRVAGKPTITTRPRPQVGDERFDRVHQLVELRIRHRRTTAMRGRLRTRVLESAR
jgi:hypothetical protein